jgi:exonuclease V
VDAADDLSKATRILARYDVNPLEPFTSVFLDDIGGINPNNEAADYPNLLSLWALLITEMQSTLPPTSLSPILRAEFRYAKTGDIIGSRLTNYETSIVDMYIAEKMAWWKGTRASSWKKLSNAGFVTLPRIVHGG